MNLESTNPAYQTANGMASEIAEISTCVWKRRASP